MVVVELRFPSGRYHATPWGSHVNEGLVEYPPSPWRLLRALLAVWHRKLRPADSEAVAAEERILERLLAALARGLPCYRLPMAVPAHTRHYMPPFAGNTTKVLDAFLDLGKEAAVLVAWPDVDLDPDAAALLARLVEVLGFLGRAESWVAGSLGTEGRDDETWNVVALRAGEAVPAGHEVVRLLAPLPPAELDAWRAAEIARRTEAALAEERAKAAAKGRSVENVKMPAKKKAQIETSLPRNLTEVLEVETGPMRKKGWNRPPGSRWLEYTRPVQLTTASPAATRTAPRGRTVLPTVARYVLVSQAPPRLTETVAVADRVRASLQKFTDGAPVFSGKAPDGQPLEGHGHAFIFCEAHRGHGRISHVTIHAPMGFDERAQEALGRLLKVWGHGGHDLQLVLTGIGRPRDFAGRDTAAGQCPLLATARVWESHTPFVPTRHLKVTRAGRPKLDDRGLVIGSPEHDLTRLLTERFAQPVHVEKLDETRLGGRPTRWSAFRTLRVRGAGRRSSAVGHGFRVEFPEPVSGPIAVGYGAHFGLGTFIPGEPSPQPSPRGRGGQNLAPPSPRGRGGQNLDEGRPDPPPLSPWERGRG